jgi:hypothetical protein
MTGPTGTASVLVPTECLRGSRGGRGVFLSDLHGLRGCSHFSLPPEIPPTGGAFGSGVQVRPDPLPAGKDVGLKSKRRRWGHARKEDG